MRPTAPSPWLPSVFLAALMTSACATNTVAPPIRPPDPVVAATVPSTTSTTAPPASTTVVTSPTPPAPVARPCDLPTATPPPVDGDAVAASVEVAHTLVCSSTDVVVARPGEHRIAARVAGNMGAPLVYADADRPYDADHLGAARAWTTDPSLVRPGRHAVMPLPEEAGRLPELVAAIEDGAVSHEAALASVEGAAAASTLVAVSPGRPELGAVAAAAAGTVDATAVWSAPGDMRRRRSLATLAEASERRLLVGDYAPAASWQTDVLAEGRQLPGGGQVFFPGRRLVALYGHPDTAGLGVLGEHSPAAAVDRAAALAEPYATDGARVLPTFEIIATTATAGAGADGDYSTESSIDELRPWVEAAAQAGHYVVLDLQPGRTDFLTQAKRYEELLRLPHVGLALDPEWRLGAGEHHLRQIGSVSAEEVNTVARWLADLVREELLPQKLLVVHQFKLSMISDRSEIESRPELALVIQMDGQGPLGTKYDTWQALLDADDRNWLWGWKNFFDEDSPIADPGQVLDLEPVPVFVSYQ